MLAAPDSNREYFALLSFLLLKYYRMVSTWKFGSGALVPLGISIQFCPRIGNWSPGKADRLAAQACGVGEPPTERISVTRDRPCTKLSTPLDSKRGTTNWNTVAETTLTGMDEWLLAEVKANLQELKPPCQAHRLNLR
jgi:hypothetical protein